MLGNGEALALECFALAHRGQAAAVLVFRIVVAAFLIDREEAVELHDLTGGAQFQRARTGLGGDIDGGALEFGGFHLARHGAHPDQFIKTVLIVIEPGFQLGRTARQVGRADGFVSLLRILGLR